MRMSNRQKKILASLLRGDTFLTTAQIAEDIGASKKTVYRELQELRYKLKEIDVEIETKIGSGIKLHINPDTRNLLNLELANENDMSIHNRRYEILVDLLQNAPSATSISKLSDQYFISKSSIQNDLKFIEDWIKKYHLVVIKGIQGTQIKGEEIDIRKALTEAIVKYRGYANNYELALSSRISFETQTALYLHFKKDTVDYVEQLIALAEKELGFVIGDPYYINIITHILILIHRVKSGNKLDKKVLGINEVNIHIFRVAVEISAKINSRFSVEIPESEIYYIYQHLDSTGLSDEKSLTNQQFKNVLFDESLKEYCDRLLELMSQEMKYAFATDAYLKRYLLLHLHSMIGRQKYQIEISCPLLEHVKQDYHELFHKIQKVISEITLQTYPKYIISDDEIAYLTLYFQGSLEERIHQKLRVIVVCSSGIGTSHLLMTRMQKTFPDWEIVDQLASSQLNSKQLTQKHIDLIVSTVNIAEFNLPIPLAYVSVLFHEEDIQNIQRILKKERDEKNG